MYEPVATLLENVDIVCHHLVHRLVHDSPDEIVHFGRRPDTGGRDSSLGSGFGCLVSSLYLRLVRFNNDRYAWKPFSSHLKKFGRMCNQDHLIFVSLIEGRSNGSPTSLLSLEWLGAKALAFSTLGLYVVQQKVLIE